MEKKVAKLPDKDGWIRINEFLKFALATDLCKVEFHDKVFAGELDDAADDKKTKTDAKKESKPSKPTKVKVINTIILLLHLNNYSGYRLRINKAVTTVTFPLF